MSENITIKQYETRGISYLDVTIGDKTVKYSNDQNVRNPSPSLTITNPTNIGDTITYYRTPDQPKIIIIDEDISDVNKDIPDVDGGGKRKSKRRNLSRRRKSKRRR
jgi:hypothetical protein